MALIPAVRRIGFNGNLNILLFPHSPIIDGAGFNHLLMIVSKTT